MRMFSRFSFRSQGQNLGLASALAAAFFLTGLGRGEALGDVSKEYQIKAAFLFHFAQFVDWPSAAFSGPGAPLCIGVLGQDPFDGALSEIVRGEKVDGHQLIVRHFSQADQVSGCHILFVSGSEKSQVEGIVAGLKGQAVLTVGDSEGFTAKGGMIRFVTENKKIRLKINLESAREAGLQISSKLLRPADVVAGGKD